MIEEQSVAGPTFPSSQGSSSQAIAVEVLSDGKLAQADNDQAMITSRGTLFPQKLLNVGFCLALVLAGFSLVTGAFYLNNFLNSTNQGIQDLITKASSIGSTISPETLDVAIFARLTMARMALLSCGIFIGMAFGFLGFALFLMGIKDEMNVTGRHESSYIKLARLSPGVFIILCSTILIGTCVTRSPQLSYYNKSAPGPSKTVEQQQEVPELPTRTRPLP